MAMEGVSSWMEISPLVHLSPESGSSGVLVLLCWCVSRAGLWVDLSAPRARVHAMGAGGFGRILRRVVVL